MANLIKHHKHVAALPTTLEADSIYYVRAGDGYDQYVTNASGTLVAYRSNAVIRAEEAVLLTWLGV